MGGGRGRGARRDWVEGEGGELAEIGWREREGSYQRLGGGRGRGARRDWVEGGVEGGELHVGEIGWREGN